MTERGCSNLNLRNRGITFEGVQNQTRAEGNNGPRNEISYPQTNKRQTPR
jgi:hypothetical protein